MKKSRLYVVLASSLMILICIIYQGAYAFFSASVGGTGNTSNNTSSVTAVSLGEIKYDGNLIFQGEKIYPGYIGIQTFTIGPDVQTGKGIYEIDLDATVPEVFGDDIEVTLYKTTDSTTNNVKRVEGTIKKEGDQYSKEDTITITGTPEVIYQEVLTEDSQIILEQSEFEVPGLQNTTYYLVYHYKNNGEQSAQQGSTFKGKITVRYILEKKVLYATEYLTELATTDTTNLVYDNTVDNNLRYIGANPNNYVLFNNELWRIIGVMNNVSDDTGDTAPKLKIRRKAYYNTAMAWDNPNVNDWSRATGQIELNTTYYESLSEKEKIANIKWKLGGVSDFKNALASHFYGYERGTDVYSGHATEWTGHIGLMYLSDYGHATSGGATTNREACLAKALYGWNDASYSDCKANDWLYDSSNYQWTLTPRSSNSYDVFYVYNAGYVYNNSAFVRAAVSPTLYLNPEVTIVGGSGTESDPYQLG